MKILVVGAGAVGGYFGARLAQAGRDVTFLVRPARGEQLRRDGLRIHSPHGNVTIAPQLVGAGGISAPFELILLSVKAYGLAASMDDMAPAVGPASMILPVLNGMRHIDELAARFGEAPLLGGVCRIASELDAEGRIVQLAEMQQIIYGERDGRASERIRAVDAAMQGAGFDARLSPAITQAMWDKWVQLASLGAATCLLGGAVGQIVAAPGGAELIRQIIDECASVAAACGHAPTPAFLAPHVAALTQAGSKFASSMYRDMRKRLPVEADHILGDMVARGAAHGAATPLLRAALVALLVYQDALAGR
jgi:2-dehydropantoate 2-reductase